MIKDKPRIKLIDNIPDSPRFNDLWFFGKRVFCNKNPYDKRINVVDKKKNINNIKFIFKHYTKIFNLLYDHYQHTYIYFLSMI